MGAGRGRGRLLTEPSPRRGLSVSTKIFLGFALVIVAFVGAFAFTLVRTNALRANLLATWDLLVAVGEQLDELSRKLRAPQEFLELRRPYDAQYLTQFLPKPFERLVALEAQLDALARQSSIAETDRARVQDVASSLASFRAGQALYEAVDGEPLDPEVLAEKTSEALFLALMRRTVKLANEGQLTQSSPEARATIKALRSIDRVVTASSRELQRSIRGLPERAADEERTTTLAVVLIAAGALVLSLVMLIVSQLTLAPIKELQAGAQRIGAGHYDETVRVRSGDEIGQLAREFNKMAAALLARDAELAEQRKELLRADRLATIGKLAAQITHEVRNPLLSIGLNAEMLEEELEEAGADEEARELLESIVAEVQRLKAITGEYLRFARLPRPELQVCDVGAVVDQLLSFLQREVAAGGVTVDAAGVAAAAAGAVAPIHADPDQLRQAVLNLLRNAVEALGEIHTERKLQVSVEAGGEGDAAHVTVTVADNGPGIPPEILESVFEPFVTGKAGGTGLGLALTQQFVHEHGGRIDAEVPGLDGRGARFVVRLPSRRSGSLASVESVGSERL